MHEKYLQNINIYFVEDIIYLKKHKIRIKTKFHEVTDLKPKKFARLSFCEIYKFQFL